MSQRVKRVVFTKEMKKEYTILVPTMLPMHFEIICRILNKNGYKAEISKSLGFNMYTTIPVIPRLSL